MSFLTLCSPKTHIAGRQLMTVNSFPLLDEFIYWANKKIDPNPVEVVNTVFFMQSRPYFDNLGDAISATSYALLLYLAKNEYEAAVPIMQWMQTQRNALMKFSSTQVNPFFLRRRNTIKILMVLKELPSLYRIPATNFTNKSLILHE